MAEHKSPGYPNGYPKKILYDHWLAILQSVNYWRKLQVDFWSGQIQKLRKYLDACPDYPYQDLVQDQLGRLTDIYYFYLYCPVATIASEFQIRTDYGLYGPAINCPQCDGYGWVGDRLCICTACHGLGKHVPWFLEKYKHRNECSIVCVSLNKQGIAVDYKEYGISYWSYL